MRFPSTCFAGRIIIRDDQLGGLDWRTPCPIPPEESLPFNPPLFFCVQHYEVAVDNMYEALERAGLVDHSVVTGPQDEFDTLMQMLGGVEDEGPA